MRSQVIVLVLVSCSTRDFDHTSRLKVRYRTLERDVGSPLRSHGQQAKQIAQARRLAEDHVDGGMTQLIEICSRTKHVEGVFNA